jgi:phage shock protein A
MSLIDRAENIVKAKASHLIDGAEDPNETLDYSYEQMQAQLQNFKRSVVEVVTAKKRLEVEAAGLEATVAKLDAQAKQAVAAGRDDLATTALTRKAGIQAQLADIQGHVQDLETQQGHLTDEETQLETKIEGFRTQKEVMKAQYSGAKAEVEISESATGIKKGFDNAGAAIERAQAKTDEMTARASAINELTASGALEDQLDPSSDLDRQLAAVSTSAEVDSELAALKAELNPGTSAPALSEGAPATPEAPAAADAPTVEQ